MQGADLAGDANKASDEIAEDAVEARACPVELLMRIWGGEEFHRRRRKREFGLQISARAGVGEVEMEPQPAALPLDWLATGKLFCGSILLEPKGPNQPRQGLRLGVRNRRDGRRSRLHGKRLFSTKVEERTALLRSCDSLERWPLRPDSGLV